MKAKILIAENERIIAIDIKNSLQRLGFKVTALVSTGEEVMRKVKEEKPDLILMDIKLDGPLSGIKTAEIITDHYNIPIIYLTAYSDRETLQNAKITEPYGYLIKPFDSREIEIAIEMAFIKRGISFEDTTGPIYPVIYN
jgi:DNA-binding NarL/FixJ family response regulator